MAGTIQHPPQQMIADRHFAHGMRGYHPGVGPQSLQDVGLYRLKQYVYAAWSGHNLALRISEANSL